jgi:hypothetical protein
MINKSDIGVASTANDCFLMTHLSEKNAGVKIAAWALDVNAMPVKIHVLAAFGQRNGVLTRLRISLNSVSAFSFEAHSRRFSLSSYSHLIQPILETSQPLINAQNSSTCMTLF